METPARTANQGAYAPRSPGFLQLASERRVRCADQCVRRLQIPPRHAQKIRFEILNPISSHSHNVRVQQPENGRRAGSNVGDLDHQMPDSGAIQRNAHLAGGNRAAFTSGDHMRFGAPSL